VNIGNFLRETELFLFRLPKNKFTEKDMTAAQKGWLSSYDLVNRVIDDDTSSSMDTGSATSTWHFSFSS
jgi:hypothetical protein